MLPNHVNVQFIWQSAIAYKYLQTPQSAVSGAALKFEKGEGLHFTLLKEEVKFSFSATVWDQQLHDSTHSVSEIGKHPGCKMDSQMCVTFTVQHGLFIMEISQNNITLVILLLLPCIHLNIILPKCICHDSRWAAVEFCSLQVVHC